MSDIKIDLEDLMEIFQIKDKFTNKVTSSMANHLINELGISKVWVESLVVSRIENIIEEQVKQKLNGRWFDEFLHRILLKIIKDGFDSQYSDMKNKSIETLIKETIQREVKNLVTSNYTISIQKKEQE